MPFSNVILHPSKASIGRHIYRYIDLTTQNNIRNKDKKTLVLCCMFLAKWKITRKSATICARRNSFIIANNNCVYAAESAIIYTTVIPDLFITNQKLFARTHGIGKSFFFSSIVHSFYHSFLQQLIAKIY